MAVGPWDVAFYLGVKQLLWDDNKDKSFWEHFSEFVEAEQPPLTFPIPPTLDLALEREGTAIATATPTTQPTSPPTESNNTVDNHYQLSVLSDIQNTEKKPLNDEDIEKWKEHKP